MGAGGRRLRGLHVLRPRGGRRRRHLHGPRRPPADLPDLPVQRRRRRRRPADGRGRRGVRPGAGTRVRGVGPGHLAGGRRRPRGDAERACGARDRGGDRGAGVVRPDRGGGCGRPRLRGREATRRVVDLELLVDDLGDGEVRLHLGHLDLHLFAHLRARDDDDVAPLDAGDAVALLAEVLDLDVTGLVLLDGGLWLRTRDRPTAVLDLLFDQGHPVSRTRLDVASLDLAAWHLDRVLAAVVCDLGTEQTE